MKKLGDTTMIIEAECVKCHSVHEIEVNLTDWWDYEEGGLVQDCFPYLSASEREMFITGICEACWNEMFADDEEEI